MLTSAIFTTILGIFLPLTGMSELQKYLYVKADGHQLALSYEIKIVKFRALFVLTYISGYKGLSSLSSCCVTFHGMCHETIGLGLTWLWVSSKIIKPSGCCPKVWKVFIDYEVTYIDTVLESGVLDEHAAASA